MVVHYGGGYRHKQKKYVDIDVDTNVDIYVDILIGGTFIKIQRPPPQPNPIQKAKKIIKKKRRHNDGAHVFLRK